MTTFLRSLDRIPGFHADIPASPPESATTSASASPPRTPPQHAQQQARQQQGVRQRAHFDYTHARDAMHRLARHLAAHPDAVTPAATGAVTAFLRLPRGERMLIPVAGSGQDLSAIALTGTVYGLNRRLDGDVELNGFPCGLRGGTRWPPSANFQFCQQPGMLPAPPCTVTLPDHGTVPVAQAQRLDTLLRLPRTETTLERNTGFVPGGDTITFDVQAAAADSSNSNSNSSSSANTRISLHVDQANRVQYALISDAHGTVTVDLSPPASTSTSTSTSAPTVLGSRRRLSNPTPPGPDRIQRRRTGDDGNNPPLPPHQPSANDIVLVPRLDGLHHEDQAATALVTGIQGACPSHAINQAFQGIASHPGEFAASTHVTDLEALRRRTETLSGTPMQSRSVLPSQVSGVTPGQYQAALNALTGDLGNTSVALFEVGQASGGADAARTGNTPAGNHFGTLVHVAAQDGHAGYWAMLDSLGEERDHATLGTALETIRQRNAALDDQGIGFLSMTLPQYGRTLPPAPTNPLGAYVPNAGFVFARNLTDAQIAAVEQEHGAQPALRQAVQQARQAAPPSHAAGVPAPPIPVHDHAYWRATLKQHKQDLKLHAKDSNHPLQLDLKLNNNANGGEWLVDYLHAHGMALSILQLDQSYPAAPSDRTLRWLLGSLAARGAWTPPPGAMLQTASRTQLITWLQGAARPSPGNANDPRLHLHVEELLFLHEHQHAAPLLADIAAERQSQAKTLNRTIPGKLGAAPRRPPGQTDAERETTARNHIQTRMRPFLTAVKQTMPALPGAQPGTMFGGHDSGMADYQPRDPWHAALLRHYLGRLGGGNTDSTTIAYNNAARAYLRAIETRRSFLDPSPLPPHSQPDLAALCKLAHTSTNKLTAPGGFLTYLTENNGGNWHRARQSYRAQLRGQAPQPPAAVPAGPATIIEPANFPNLSDTNKEWALSYERQLRRRPGGTPTPQHHYEVFVNMLAWMQTELFPATLADRIDDRDLNNTVLILGGTLQNDPRGQRQWLQQVQPALMQQTPPALALDIARLNALPQQVQNLLVMHVQDTHAIAYSTRLMAALNDNDDLDFDLVGMAIRSTWRPRLQENQAILDAARQSSTDPRVGDTFARWIYATELDWQRAWQPGGANPNPVAAALNGSFQQFEASLRRAGIVRQSHQHVFKPLESFHRAWQASRAQQSAPPAGQPLWRRNAERLQRFLAHLDTIDPTLRPRAQSLVGGWMARRERHALQPHINPLIDDVLQPDTAAFAAAVLAGSTTLQLSTIDMTILRHCYDWFLNGAA
jgi:hypothetical protein